MRHMPIADMARIVCPRSHPVKPMALIQAYFDESGTDGQRGVTTLAGFIGSEWRWTALEELWLKDLDTYEVPQGKFGIPVMHLVDALEGRGDFAHLGSKRHDLIIGLSKKLGESGVTCLFSGVLDDAWNEVALHETSFIARAI